jgi:hypothetical protein
MFSYFKSNESNFARVLSKWLTILLSVLTPISISGVFHGKTVGYIIEAINIITLAIKLIIPFTGSNDNDLKALKANCNDTVNQTPNK